MFSKKIFKDMTGGNPSKMEVSSGQLIMVHPWLNLRGKIRYEMKKYPSNTEIPFDTHRNFANKQCVVKCIDIICVEGYNFREIHQTHNIMTLFDKNFVLQKIMLNCTQS